MKVFIFAAFAVVCGRTVLGLDPHKNTKVVCYWNSTAFERTNPGKFEIGDVEAALGFCTDLVYGYAGINAENFEIISLNPQLDTGAGYAYYKLVTHLKKSFPDLKIHLGIGGNADPEVDTHKYLTLTETAAHRTRFINSVQRLLNDYEFDGIDLAWQFPPTSVKKKRSKWHSFWGRVAKIFGAGPFEDDKELEHRDGFTILVRELNAQLKLTQKTLSVTVLPRVNSTAYYDVKALVPNIDAVHLFAFDQRTPENSPKEADYPAPIYRGHKRVPEDNTDAIVRYWLNNGTPGSKIVIGVPTFGRTWKLTSESQISGEPPLVADGPGAEGPLTGMPGVLSYEEVCSRLTESTLGRLTKVSDPTNKYGSYAFQRYNSDTGADGIWVGYEDPDTAGSKAAYARENGLGGVAIVDLSLDDFKGICTGDKYPILRGAKHGFVLVFTQGLARPSYSNQKENTVWSPSSQQSVQQSTIPQYSHKSKK